MRHEKIWDEAVALCYSNASLADKKLEEMVSLHCLPHGDTCATQLYSLHVCNTDNNTLSSSSVVEICVLFIFLLIFLTQGCGNERKRLI